MRLRVTVQVGPQFRPHLELLSKTCDETASQIPRIHLHQLDIVVYV